MGEGEVSVNGDGPGGCLDEATVSLVGLPLGVSILRETRYEPVGGITTRRIYGRNFESRNYVAITSNLRRNHDTIPDKTE